MIMKIGILGCAGKMGQMLVQEVLKADGCALAGGTEQPENLSIGKDVAGLSGGEPAGVLVTDDSEFLIKNTDAVIDFTRPEATLVHAQIAAESGTVLIIGTTGLNDIQQLVLQRAAETTALVQAANMSVGVNVLFGLTRQAASILGDDYDIEVVEMHHRHKVDAPSGTALALGNAAAEGRNIDLKTVSQRVRDGITGPRNKGDIGFATLRGGDVVGDHTVILAGDGERIEITHKAGSREVFARGAVRAALWANGKTPGLYSMRDVLGLE
jgi:4-hydroxy-tetrahydrodipicolinate reductase